MGEDRGGRLCGSRWTRVRMSRREVTNARQKLRSQPGGAGVWSRQPRLSMKANVGSYDCAVRFVAGCLALLVGNHYLSWWGLVGVVPILTAMVGFCPMYLLFGLDTTACDRREHRM